MCNKKKDFCFEKKLTFDLKSHTKVSSSGSKSYSASVSVSLHDPNQNEKDPKNSDRI